MIKAIVISMLAALVIILPGQSASADVNGQWEQKVQYRINKVRDNRNLVKVRHGRCVDRRAERLKWHLSDEHFHHHDLAPLMNRCNAYYAGEILARGTLTPRQVVRLWMNSPSHKAVIVNPAYRRVGVAMRRTGDGRKIVVVNFIRH